LLKGMSGFQNSSDAAERVGDWGFEIWKTIGVAENSSKKIKALRTEWEDYAREIFNRREGLIGRSFKRR